MYNCLNSTGGMIYGIYLYHARIVCSTHYITLLLYYSIRPTHITSRVLVISVVMENYYAGNFYYGYSLSILPAEQ